MAVDSAELVVHEIDRRLGRQAELGERAGRRVLLVDHPDLDRRSVGLDGLIRDERLEGRCSGTIQQLLCLAAGRCRTLGVDVAGLGLGLAARREQQAEDDHHPQRCKSTHRTPPGTLLWPY